MVDLQKSNVKSFYGFWDSNEKISNIQLTQIKLWATSLLFFHNNILIKNTTSIISISRIIIVNSINKIDKSYLFDFEIPKKERKHLIEKASICVNGISLTISKITKKGFQIWVIPHTYKETNLSSLKKSSLVNIEIDILSKYVRNYFNDKK